MVSRSAADQEELDHPTGWRRWVFSTNHKDIGTMYLVFSLTMLFVGGAMSLVIRAELFQPGLQFVNPGFFNQMTTLHALVMVFGMIMPAFAGFANWMVPMMIGMIALAGIIVRNSILLVDFINQEVARGIDFQEAVIQAASVRAKPIALTALAAILGAMFILDDPIFNGLAIALISGILVSTLLTLIVIPVMFYAFNYRRLENEGSG